MGKVGRKALEGGSLYRMQAVIKCFCGGDAAFTLLFFSC